MDGAPASSVEVADEVVLDRKQVGAAASDEGLRLVEPAFIALGSLVPGRPIGRMHRPDIAGLGRGGGADIRGRERIRHPFESSGG